MAKRSWVYIMASRSGVLYVGVTNNLMRRVYEHKKKLVSGFTRRYNVTRLVHFETSRDIRAAIGREKQIKGWVREKKRALISANNPKWEDLSAEWFVERGPISELNKPRRRA